MSGDICGCQTRAGGNTGTYGAEAEETAEHLTIPRKAPTRKNELAQNMKCIKSEEPDFRSFKFPSPDRQKKEARKPC